MIEFESLNVFRSNVQTFVDTFRLVDSAIDKFNAEEMPVIKQSSEFETPTSTDDENFEKLREFAQHLGRYLTVKQAVAWQNGWYVVMMVTITEAYLRDTLAEAGKYDSSFMKNSEQSLTYHDVCNADSIELLSFRMRDTWAKSFVETGGPKRWFEKLRRWGAKDLTDQLLLDLERMWGIRHVMVHRAGKIDSDFLSRHSDFSADKTGNVVVASDDVGDLTMSAIDFAKAVNAYLVNRCTANTKA